jgi:hypothetical protein
MGSEFFEQLGSNKCCRINRDLVGTGVEYRLRVANGSDAAADREGNENVVGGTSGQGDDRLPPFVGGGDVEKDQLICALGVIPFGKLDRIASITQADEVGALDHAPGVYVKAGYYSFQDHGYSLDWLDLGYAAAQQRACAESSRALASLIVNTRS